MSDQKLMSRSNVGRSLRPKLRSDRSDVLLLLEGGEEEESQVTDSRLSVGWVTDLRAFGEFISASGLSLLRPKRSTHFGFFGVIQFQPLFLLLLLLQAVTIPLGSHDNCPISVSLLARHGDDRFLLDTVHTMYASIQEQADVAVKSKLSSNVLSPETSAEIAEEKGNQAFKEKQWLKATGLYTEAIRLNVNNATYYSNRAAAYLEVGSLLQAEADCTKAIDLDKMYVKAYLRRGTAREMLGYYKEAIEDFRYALVLEPTNKRAAVSAERLRKLFQ